MTTASTTRATAIKCDIYRGPCDCTLDGVTGTESGFSEVLLISEHSHPADHVGAVPVFQVDVMNPGTAREFRRALLVYDPRRPEVDAQARWYCFGGNYLYSSDSRFAEVAGMRHPVKALDRYETQAIRDQVSR